MCQLTCQVDSEVPYLLVYFMINQCSFYYFYYLFDFYIIFFNDRVVIHDCNLNLTR